MSDVTRLDDRMDANTAYANFCRRLAAELEALPPLRPPRENLTTSVRASGSSSRERDSVSAQVADVKPKP